MSQRLGMPFAPPDRNEAPSAWLRRSATRQRLARLRTDVADWFVSVRRQPFASLLDTPLKALQTVLNGAVGRVQRELDAVTGLAAKGVVYARCQLLDDKILWTWRLFEFFREKIDQRLRPELAGFLEAADEVAWSCFHTAFDANPDHAQVKRRATPLPYVEAHYTPRAVLVQARLSELAFQQDPTFLERCLRELPIPLIGLPRECVDAPWSLAILGHEVGHQVQFLQLPERRMVAGYQESVERAARAVEQDLGIAGADSRGEVWGKWSVELYADLHAVAHFGEAAAWIIHDWLWTDDDRMWNSTEWYPSTGLRNAVLRAACAEFGIAHDPVLEEWTRDSAAFPVAKVDQIDLQLAPRIVARVVADEIGGCASLRSVARFALPQIDAMAVDYATQLRSAAGAEPPRGEAVTRRIMADGVRAWASLVPKASEDVFEGQRAQLARNLARAIVFTRRSVLRAEDEEIDFHGSELRFWELLDAEVRRESHAGGASWRP